MLCSSFVYLSDDSPVVINDANTADGLTGWKQGNPDNWNGVEHHLHILTWLDLWNDVEATSYYQTVCELDTGPNYGWKTIDDLQIFIAFEQVSIVDAANYCTDNGAKVFEPKSGSQAMAVLEQAKKLGFDMYWLGISDSDNDGRY